jgi:aryl-alcohol dehydrogenase-like predicted oxidoreductase
MIEKIPFGRTGHNSSRVIFGAAAFWDSPQAIADKTLELLLEYGINHIDTAASYGDSELRIGPWMKQHRDTFFLATKTGKRTYSEAKAEFYLSLKRLQVDSVDLIQLHHLVDPQEWDIAFGEDGVIKWLMEARELGLTRFIGVTGHEVAIAQRHLESTNAFDFDSILLPYNYTMMQNEEYAQGFEVLMERAKERNIAVQTIKAISRRLWPSDTQKHATTWYEPFTEQADIDIAVHWVLGREGVFLNSPGDVNLLPKVLDAASRFERRPSEEEMAVFIRDTEARPMFF